MIEVPIIGKPNPTQREAFREAKRVLRVADQLLFVEARPGCGRALSFGPKPEFACDWVELWGDEPADAAEALGWMLKLTQTHRRSTVGRWLSDVLGAEVRELRG